MKNQVMTIAEFQRRSWANSALELKRFYAVKNPAQIFEIAHGYNVGAPIVCSTRFNRDEVWLEPDDEIVLLNDDPEKPIDIHYTVWDRKDLPVGSTLSVLRSVDSSIAHTHLLSFPAIFVAEIAPEKVFYVHFLLDDCITYVESVVETGHKLSAAQTGIVEQVFPALTFGGWKLGEIG